MGDVAQFFLSQPKLFAWARVPGKYERTNFAINPKPDPKAVTVGWEHANTQRAGINFLNHWLDLGNGLSGEGIQVKLAHTTSLMYS